MTNKVNIFFIFRLSSCNYFEKMTVHIRVHIIVRNCKVKMLKAGQNFALFCGYFQESNLLIVRLETGVFDSMQGHV